MAKLPDIPSTESVPSGPLAWVKNWADSVRLWLQSRDPRATQVGDPRDKFVDRQELLDKGLYYRTSSGAFLGTVTGIPGPAGPPGAPGVGVEAPDYTPPPTPTGLAVVAGITQITISWDAASYTTGHGHAQTNIYGAIWEDGDTEPTFGDVRTKFITSAVNALTLASYPSQPSTTWCIWISHQSVDGIDGADAGNIAGGTHGVQATTGEDVEALLDILTNKIRINHLYSALARPIFGIDQDRDEAAADTLAALLAAHKEKTDRHTSITQLRTVVDEGDAQSAALVTELAAVVDDNYAAITSTYSTTADMNAAIALSADTLTTAFEAGDSDTLATAQAFTYSRASIDGAIAASALDLTAAFEDGDATTLASAQSYTYSQAAIDGAIASSSSVLEASLTDDIAAAVAVEAAARADLDGSVAALYTVRAELSSGGRTVVGGFGLSATSTEAAGPRIDFGVRADQFWVAAPSGTGVADIVPFVIRTTTTTENGVTISPGVYIDAAYIVNLTAAYALIQSLVADDITVADLSATQLTLGDGSVGGNLKSTTFVAGSGSTPGLGWRLTPGGDLHANSGTFYGTIYATAGVFGGQVKVGTSPAISGTTMTGSGAVINADGSFAFGDADANITSPTGGPVRINGPLVLATNITAEADSYDTYSSTATDTVDEVHAFSIIDSTGGVVQAGANGYVDVYLNTASDRILSMYVRIEATNGVDTIVSPACVTTFNAGQGFPWSFAGTHYRTSLPFSLTWAFTGSYYQSVKAFAPGVSGTLPSPTLVDNFLDADSWTMNVHVVVTTYTTAGAASSVIEYVRTSVGGWSTEVMGAARHDPASPIL